MVTNDLIAVLPELLLIGSALALLMYGSFTGAQSTLLITRISVGVLLLAALLAVFDLIALKNNPEITGYRLFGGLMAYDEKTAIGRIMVFAFTAFALMLARVHITRKGYERFEMPLLYLISSVGMAMMLASNDMMTLFIGIELMSLSLYVIASMRRDDLRATEAGLKYFVLGALSSGLLLYGISLIYGFGGATNFSVLASNIDAFALAAAAKGSTLDYNIGLLIGLVFLITGLAFKLSAVPFHMWTPDVYHGAPTPVVSFFATAPKAAAVMLMLRLLYEPFAQMSAQWQQVLIVLALASMFFGAIAAVRQQSLKRLMAYSSIANIGFILVAMASATDLGYAAAINYLVIYVINVLGLFAVILMLRSDGRPLDDIDSLAGLSKNRPAAALAMTILLFSITGIPPLSGFFGKLYVFMAAVKQDLVWLAVLGLVASVIAAVYYLRLVKLMYFDAPQSKLDKEESPARSMIAWAAAVFALVLILVQNSLLAWIG